MEPKEILKDILPEKVLCHLEAFNRSRLIREWKKHGEPLPPPHAVKQSVILEYKRKFQIEVLVETGTFRGDTIFAQRHSFKRIYSIELDPVLHTAARERLRKFGHVQLLQGDSGMLISELARSIHEPCLFWLDGHYSGGETARGVSETPIMNELHGIFSTGQSHIVLIDDARLFIGQNDYPTIDALRNFVFRLRTSYDVSVKWDIIRLVPKV